MENQRFKEQFDLAIRELMNNKRQDNTVLFTENTYNEVIEKVKNAKIKKKGVEDYRLLKRYDVLTVQGSEYLINPIQDGGNIVHYAKISELFNILFAEF